MKRYLGIDPGLTGAIVALNEDGKLVWAEPMPTAGGDYNLHFLVGFLSRTGVEMVGIEQQQVFPKNGNKANFLNGFCYGMLQAICACNGFPVTIVPPKHWQATLLAGNPKGRKAIKAAAVSFAASRWPDLPPMRGESGFADAAIIAEFVRRKAVRGYVYEKNLEEG